MCSIACWRRAPLAYARARILHMHTSSVVEHSIVHYAAACRRVQHRVPAQRDYAHLRDARMRARRLAVVQERGARRRNEILEHASPVLCSGLGKIGQAGDPGIVTPGRDRGRLGARCAGR